MLTTVAQWPYSFTHFLSWLWWKHGFISWYRCRTIYMEKLFLMQVILNSKHSIVSRVWLLFFLSLKEENVYYCCKWVLWCKNEFVRSLMLWFCFYLMIVNAFFIRGKCGVRWNGAFYLSLAGKRNDQCCNVICYFYVLEWHWMTYLSRGLLAFQIYTGKSCISYFKLQSRAGNTMYRCKYRCEM